MFYVLIYRNRSFYFQQMVMVGSATTLDIAKQLIERQQISNEDIMNMISGFSMFLRDPSDRVLGQLLVSEPNWEKATLSLISARCIYIHHAFGESLSHLLNYG